jgi:hypothetical protein
MPSRKIHHFKFEPMFNKLKQIKDLRSQANEMKNMLAQETVTGEAKGGKITIVMDGNQEIQSVNIDPELLSPDNKKNVEDGIREAVQSAVKEVQKIMVKKMQSGDISMPNFS